jgi:futalosine hydrolase
MILKKTDMNILIVAAEQEELDFAIAAYNSLKGNLADKVSVTFRLTGIGATQACHTVTREIYLALMEQKPYDFVMDIGIAGSYDMDMFPMGSAAIVREEHFGDLGFETDNGFKDLFQYGILKKDGFPYTDGALKRTALPFPQVERCISRYKEGIGITVQTVTGDPAKVESLVKRYNPHIESMEGAAVYFACIMENVPFFELRTVSNAVGERDMKKWDIPAALATLEKCCMEILEAVV